MRKVLPQTIERLVALEALHKKGIQKHVKNYIRMLK